jgi:hypothetical protein
LTEHFKTDNALLHNSLSYVGLLSTNPDFVERNPLLAKPIGALAAAILQLTLDSSALCQIASKRDPLSRPIPTLGALRIWADECAAIRMRMRRRWCDGGRAQPD